MIVYYKKNHLYSLNSIDNALYLDSIYLINKNKADQEIRCTHIDNHDITAIFIDRVFVNSLIV